MSTRCLRANNEPVLDTKISMDRLLAAFWNVMVLSTAAVPSCRDTPGACGKPRSRAGGLQVGARRGAPVILTVDAAATHAAGHVFYQARWRPPQWRPFARGA